MTKPVRKAIFPVGGLGLRFLPATKAVPKEMLPVVDKPLIQYAVEEAQAAGVELFIFVTGGGMSAIESHFDCANELHGARARRGQGGAPETVAPPAPTPGQFVYVRQPEPLGLGHAVWCARHLVGDEPVAVLLPDDLILAATPCLKQMTDVFARVGGNLVAVMDVPREQTRRYGVLRVGRENGRLVEVEGLVEKPEPERAPSTLSIIGRYILQPEIFALLEDQPPGAGGEVQLTDALARAMAVSPLRGYRFEGTRFDGGDKAGLFEAGLAYALRHETLGPAARRLVRDYARRLDDSAD